MDTQITTAARRIARDLSATPPEVTRAYDAQGTGIGIWSTGMIHADPKAFPTDAVVIRAGGPITWREAQDAIDAAAAADAAGYARWTADWRDERDYRLDDLAATRRDRD